LLKSIGVTKLYSRDDGYLLAISCLFDKILDWVESLEKQQLKATENI